MFWIDKIEPIFFDSSETFFTQIGEDFTELYTIAMPTHILTHQDPYLPGFGLVIQGTAGTPKNAYTCADLNINTVAHKTVPMFCCFG